MYNGEIELTGTSNVINSVFALVNVYSEPGICCTTFAGISPGTITVPELRPSRGPVEYIFHNAGFSASFSQSLSNQAFLLHFLTAIMVDFNCDLEEQVKMFNSSSQFCVLFSCLCVCVDSALSHLCTRVVI